MAHSRCIVASIQHIHALVGAFVLKIHAQFVDFFWQIHALCCFLSSSQRNMGNKALRKIGHIHTDLTHKFIFFVYIYDGNGSHRVIALKTVAT